MFILELHNNLNGFESVIYPVLVSSGNENILIDCGYPNSLDLLEKEIEKNNFSLDKITKIIITHHDFDHIGLLAELKEKYPSIEILSSLEEKKYINGENKSLRLIQAEELQDHLPETEKQNGLNFQEFLKSIRSVNVNKTVSDNDIIEGLKVVSTPGHLPGHVSLYHLASKTLIPGDALVAEAGKLSIPYEQYCFDIVEAKNSIKKFLNYDIEKIICYHGGVVTENIKKQLLNLCK